MVQHPEVLWAQRSSESDPEKNIVFLTVNLPDIQLASLEYTLSSTAIHFKATTGNEASGIPEKQFAFDLDLFAEVVPEQSKKNLSSRSLTAIIRKKESQSEYWPRLTKEKVRNAFLKTDFSKWVDEDEQDGANIEGAEDDEGGSGGPGGPGGMDFSKMMASMGGGSGFDPSSLSGLGGAGGGFDPSAFSSGGSGEGSDSDDDGPPPLEDADPSK